jgi:hypothetical protein
MSDQADIEAFEDIKAYVATLPEQDQRKIELIAIGIKAIVVNHLPLSLTALALVGSELTALPDRRN